MSEDSIVNSSSVNDSIPTEIGIKAAELVSQIAEENDIAIALAGGIAMHIYGFTRATTDVDMLANRTIPVDVIVRDDKLSKIYQAALSQAKLTDVAIKIVSPEWLVVMKHFSPRAKDKIDLTWLLQEEGLVDRKQIKSNLIDAIGEDAAFYVVADLESDYSYADFLKAREKGKQR